MSAMDCKQNKAGRRLWGMMVLVLGLVAGGCTSDTDKAVKASAGALKEKDYDQTIVLATEAIEENPTGPLAAEAWYLRGRGFEQHTVTSQQQLQANMQAARSSYVEALKHNPSSKLETYIHASLGKVAFYQDDFAVAEQQLSVAYGKLDDADLKAATLYHLAKAQQRTGRFGQADQTINLLMQSYPQHELARKAAETRGVRSFYVQLAAYTNPASADAASKMVRQRDLQPMRLIDAKGRNIVGIGPYGTYAAARQMRPKILDAFPDAVIKP